jgi:hypothetical protein
MAKRETAEKKRVKELTIHCRVQLLGQIIGVIGLIGFQSFLTPTAVVQFLWVPVCNYYYYQFVVICLPNNDDTTEKYVIVHVNGLPFINIKHT